SDPAPTPNLATGNAPRQPALDLCQRTSARSAKTRRRLGGRQPLCGMGVVSVIETTCRPAVCNARIAISRPAPGPFTYTSTWRRPCSIPLRAAVSAVPCAAYGVLFRDPLKPFAPALDQAM